MESNRDHKERPTQKGASSFEGFLEGFSTSRIASLEMSIKFHLLESARLLEETEAEVAGLGADEGRKRMVGELVRTARSLLTGPPDPILPRLHAYGEALRALVLPYRALIGQHPPLADRLKTVIFHFMTVAKMSEDTRLISLALHIGNSFDRA